MKERDQLKGRKSGRNGREIGRRVVGQRARNQSHSLPGLVDPFIIRTTINTIFGLFEPLPICQQNLHNILSNHLAIPNVDSLLSSPVRTSDKEAPTLRGSSIYTLKANHATPATPTTTDSAPTDIWTSYAPDSTALLNSYEVIISRGLT